MRHDSTIQGVNRKYFQQSTLAIAIGAFAMTSNSIAEATLEEVVVTATRRAASVEDIPYNISAIDGDVLSQTGATGLTEVLRMVPGLASADVGQRQGINSSIILRGVNANNPGRNNITQNMTDAAVSMYVDDVPMYFNINAADVDRVEVLRGPQGTLYGSGSVGGTVRFILNKPSTEESFTRISGRVSANEESDELNYSTSLISNIPLTDNAALRINAGYRTLGGVTDAVGLLKVDSNNVSVLSDPSDADSAAVVLPTDEDTDGYQSTYFRGALLVNINEDVTATFSVIHQEDEGDDDTLGQITNGDTEIVAWQHGQHRKTPTEFENDMVSMDISADLGFATFTSATSYLDSQQKVTQDNSGLYATLSGLYFGYPIEQISAPSYFDQGSKTLTQEVRLVSQGESDWDWVIGAWYKDQDQSAMFNDTLPGYKRWASDPTSYGSMIAQLYYGLDTVADFWAYYQGVPSPVLDDPYVQNREMNFRDVAVFGEVTRHLSERWQITGGFRQSWQDFSQDNAIDFNILGAAYSIRAQSESTFNDAIFKFNTSYDLNDEAMIYATWSQGFRHGGANGFPTIGPYAVDESLLEYAPDEADNFEVGIKGTLSDQSLRYSLSVYRIDWENPQLDVFLGPLAIPSVINGSEARNQGIESELTAQLTDNLTMTFGYSYTSAELTKAFTIPGSSPKIGNDGDPLPGVPKRQASLALNYYQPIENGQANYYLNGSYRSEVDTTFNSDFSDYANLDGFSSWNLGVNWELDGYSVGLFVNNATNEEGMTGVSGIERPVFSQRAALTRPRSYGVSFSYNFE